MKGGNVEKELINHDVKLFLTLVLSVVLLLSFSVLVLKMFNSNYAVAKDISVTNLFFYSLISIVVVNLPWERYLRRIRKIGSVEFHNIFEDQIKEIADLEDRLSALESSVSNGESLTKITDSFYEKPLRILLFKFLSEYSPKAFSPTRIKEWGSLNEEYKEFGKHDASVIRRYLRNMLAQGELTTVISKKGNLLYKISEE